MVERSRIIQDAERAGLVPWFVGVHALAMAAAIVEVCLCPVDSDDLELGEHSSVNGLVLGINLLQGRVPEPLEGIVIRDQRVQRDGYIAGKELHQVNLGIVPGRTPRTEWE